MPSISLINQIISDYKQFTFVESSTFRWSADTQTIYFDQHADDAVFFVLHELGHALLDHQTYTQDIDLLKLERDAWHHATTNLATKYSVVIDDMVIQDNLDTYREWLHARSLCPSCHMTGLQLAQGAYSCLACGCRWKSNDARNCALRRVTLAT